MAEVRKVVELFRPCRKKSHKSKRLGKIGCCKPRVKNCENGLKPTSQLSVFVDSVTDPVNSGVFTDGLVGGVHADDLVVFVDGIVTNPVTVHYTESWRCRVRF